MRLINADALIDTLYDHEFASYIDKGEISTVINDEPTVEAIPVDWIEKWLERYSYRNYRREIIEFMVTEWKHEQEKQK